MNSLSRWDILLLPLISLATIIFLLVGGELLARDLWSAQVENACAIPDAESTRFKANCSSQMKLAEGPWYTNRYNECGYRSDSSCAAKAAGVRRLVLIGSSIAEGLYIPYDETIGAALGREMTRLCGAPVDMQNMGVAGHFGRAITKSIPEALSLHPDGMVLVLMPYDLYSIAESMLVPAAKQATARSRPSPLGSVNEEIKASRALLVVEHYLFRNEAFYVPLYLKNGDKADFLRTPLSAAWRERLHLFDQMLQGIAEKTMAAQVPLWVAYVPQQAQLALMADHMAATNVAPNVDPYALQKGLEEIAANHGARFIDGSLALLGVGKPADLFYQVDGHPNGRAQTLVGRRIATELASASSGPFSNCANEEGKKQ